ncbi:globin [Aeromicrobium duanguangcaii]|uniref:globin n=1 Tax=Aeromicrobium duanguangcaii TaxID=2968086 RepID=UPI002016ADD2|nr:globin [Aeromicrobium duanguangcaii]MCL3838733.1 globin [Aeromicrobium duanguangcaii]
MTEPQNDTQAKETFYEAIGGHATIALIVEVFYQGVAQDELLKPMYPEEDLGPAAERLTMFLEQYWGGPTTYSQRRGHPRLRMRHADYAVTEQARDHWLKHFREGLDAAQLEPELDAQFWAYAQHAANFMINAKG